ncbi:EthD family reductase [Caulobacter sp. RL271]|jgi:uncharacterized protein (TIGR02118 family)|uniref:EthD family reductase n=1 Tax=Caulobacter segnis TaxID=88688 RepID=A0ABY4ZVR0_9CAUL|nr:EthD family reductase [Caulobacter segnis]USQ96269.1 EthD family reductase [Caulobacter segnis]
MAVFTVLYPASDGAKFDYAYYENTHIPLAKAAFTATGLTGVQILKGLAGGGGAPAPYLVIVNLIFRDAEALQASLGGPRGAEVTADVANFTNVQPIVQISTEA